MDGSPVEHAEGDIQATSRIGVGGPEVGVEIHVEEQLVVAGLGVGGDVVEDLVDRAGERTAIAVRLPVGHEADDATGDEPKLAGITTNALGGRGEAIEQRGDLPQREVARDVAPPDARDAAYGRVGVTPDQ